LIDIIITLAIIVAFSMTFSAGYLFARATATQPHRGKPPDNKETVLVKRSRASFRNPARTSTTVYDEYKTSKGLYAPVKPGKGSTADDIDLTKKGHR
jgi:hypothetical protein